MNSSLRGLCNVWVGLCIYLMSRFVVRFILSACKKTVDSFFYRCWKFFHSSFGKNTIILSQLLYWFNSYTEVFCYPLPIPTPIWIIANHISFRQCLLFLFTWHCINKKLTLLSHECNYTNSLGRNYSLHHSFLLSNLFVHLPYSLDFQYSSSSYLLYWEAKFFINSDFFFPVLLSK